MLAELKYACHWYAPENPPKANCKAFGIGARFVGGVDPILRSGSALVGLGDLRSTEWDRWLVLQGSIIFGESANLEGKGYFAMLAGAQLWDGRSL